MMPIMPPLFAPYQGCDLLYLLGIICFTMLPSQCWSVTHYLVTCSRNVITFFRKEYGNGEVILGSPVWNHWG